MPRKPLLIAHRGDHGRARENTLAAFEAAMRAGADGIEFDVRATLDSQLVVHHDATWRRRTRRPALRATRSVDLPARVPRLDEVVAWAKKRPGVFLDLEAKEGGFEAEILKAAAVPGIRARLLITSFHPDILFALRALDPKIPLGLIAKDRADALLEVARESGATHVVLHRDLVDEATVRGAQGVGLQTWAWSVDDPKTAETFAQLGVSGIITDDVAALAALKR